MKRTGLARIGAIVAICALVGALAGIAGSAAAPTKKSAAAKKSAQKRAAVRKAKVLHFRGRFRGPGPAGAGIRAGGPPVHSEAVVPNAAGDGFDTITMDNGKLKSADGSKLTVTEGTDKKTYGEPTIDVGSDAKVFRNHDKATLSDLKEGDFVHVIQAPKGNLVIAESPDFRAQEEKERGHRFRGGRGFGPPPGAPAGPPPGAPDNGSFPGGDAPDGSNS
jgi:hypothetical protein